MLTSTHYRHWWGERECGGREKKKRYAADITAVCISFQLEALRFCKLSLQKAKWLIFAPFSSVVTISPLYQLTPHFYGLLASHPKIQCFVPEILLHRCRSSIWHIEDEKLKDFRVYEQMKMGQSNLSSLLPWPGLILTQEKKCDIASFKHILK